MSHARERRSMRETAYLHLQKQIASRLLRAGSPVSEAVVASELGISRTPAREAIRQLIAEGILRQVGRSVTVISLERRDLIELYEIRQALELQALQKVAQQRLGERERQNLNKIMDSMAQLIEELRRSGRERLDEKQMPRFEAAHIAFHTYLLEIAGNRRVVEICGQTRLLMSIFAMGHVGHALAELECVHREHCEIASALASNDTARAMEVAQKHIQTSQKARLEEFDQREREGALPQDISAFIDRIHAQLN
jgi:DNA-binding GntR family transcriptional regulator